MPKRYLKPEYCPKCGRDPVLLDAMSGFYTCQNTTCGVRISVTIMKETT